MAKTTKNAQPKFEERQKQVLRAFKAISNGEARSYRTLVREGARTFAVSEKATLSKKAAS